MPGRRTEGFAAWRREQPKPPPADRGWMPEGFRLVRPLWDQCAWEALKDRWSEAGAWGETGLGDDEVRELKLLIERRQYGHPIIGIHRGGEDELRIDVAWVGGPRMGAGTFVTVRRRAAGWVIENESRWIS